MTRTVRMILLGTILAFISLFAHAPRGPAQDDREAAWLKSGDPCWPTEQQKKQLKAISGTEINYLKCKPVRIKMIWDFDETYHHHSGLGDDRFSVGLEVSFQGYIQLSFDQQKRNQVRDIFIAGPSPCCPGEADFNATRLQASILCTAPAFRGDKFQVFEASGADIIYGRDAPGLFRLAWRRDGLDDKTEIAGPHFRLAQGVIKKPYAWLFSPTVMYNTNYRLKKLGAESTSWDEIRPFYEKQDLWQKEFPLEDRMDIPGTGESYVLHGKVTVQVDFAEEEREDWLMAVEGKEKDPIGGLIEYKAPDKLIKSLPINVAFDWLLESKFQVKKRKGVRSFDNGVITQFSQTPHILFEANDLYRCDLTLCEGKKASEQASRFIGMMVGGRLQGQAVNITWASFPAEACVLCTPLKSSAGKAAVRKKFGTSEFISRVNQEFVPLKDGAAKTGGIQDWMTFRLTLKKLK